MFACVTGRVMRLAVYRLCIAQEDGSHALIRADLQRVTPYTYVANGIVTLFYTSLVEHCTYVIVQ